MNLAVTALASVLPQGEGIEAFNHIVYEGLPVLGEFSESYNSEQKLLANLLQQLNKTHENSHSLSEYNIVISDASTEGFESEKSLRSALSKSRFLLESDYQRVNIFACEIKPKNECLNDIQSFAFAEGFDFSKNHKGSNFALAFSLERDFEASHLAIIEDGSMDFEHNEITFLETSKNNNEKSLNKLFEDLSERHSNDLELAIGSIATSIGYNNSHLDSAAFVKSVLQCYHRYIAGVPSWKNKNPNLSWDKVSVYINEQSKFWFVEGQDTPRLCAFNFHDTNEKIIISDRAVCLDRKSQYFSYASPHFFPIAGNTFSEFDKQIKALKNNASLCESDLDLRRLAKSYYQVFLDNEDTLNLKSYRAVLLAENLDVLFQEIELFEKGLSAIFEAISSPDTDLKHEIKTPKGSYFTTEPLGEEGKVAFVFPGLGSSYVGLGQKIFQLFPSIYKESFRFTQNVGEELQEKVLYPRTQNTLTFKEKRQRDMEIVLNLKDLGKTDTTYSSICAHVMTDVFKVHPDMAFGYSMGEANMMTALDVWQTPTELENRFKASDIFKDRLYGELRTVKRFWGLPETTDATSLWSTFTLKAHKDEVISCIHNLNLKRVYLTLINTEDNLVIAGDPQECLALLEKLGGRAIPMGFVPAIHCDPTKEEYEGIADLYSMPTTDTCATKLYSSSCYLPVPVRQKAIAYSIAKCFCEPVDFPRLVNKVYQDGARIYLEAGAGRICSTWIDKILQGKKHVIIPLNAKGTDDSLTFARVMAKLFCHKVDVNLAPLYENVD
jgi:PfaB family protein